MSEINEALPENIQQIRDGLLERVQIVKSIEPTHKPDTHYWDFLVTSKYDHLANFTLRDEWLKNRTPGEVINQVSSDLHAYFSYLR